MAFKPTFLFGEKSKNKYNGHNIQRPTTVASSTKSIPFQRDLPDKSNNICINENIPTSPSDHLGNEIDPKRQHKERIQTGTNVQFSKIDAVMKIRKLPEDARKKNPPTISSDQVDDFMLVRARLKRANNKKFAFNSKMQQDCEEKDSNFILPQPLSNHLESEVGNSNILLTKTNMQIPFEERMIYKERGRKSSQVLKSKHHQQLQVAHLRIEKL